MRCTGMRRKPAWPHFLRAASATAALVADITCTACPACAPADIACPACPADKACLADVACATADMAFAKRAGMSTSCKSAIVQDCLEPKFFHRETLTVSIHECMLQQRRISADMAWATIETR